MNTKSLIIQTSKIILINLIVLVLIGPAYAAPRTSPVNLIKDERRTLLQFTSGEIALGFASQGMYAANGSHALHVNFLNANDVQPQADPAAKVSKVGNPLSKVTYANLWDGITLGYTAKPGSVYETTYIVAPGADPNNIHLQYNAPLRLNKDGSLNINFERGKMTESAPVAWQEINGKQIPINVSFSIQRQGVTFNIGKYDTRFSLIIDPSLMWNTFLDGGALDIAVDGSGNIYVVGGSGSTWGSPIRPYTSMNDASVFKLSPSGTLIWNTFLGGSGSDDGGAIAVDASGNIYVAGYSYVTWGSPVRAFIGGSTAFAAKLNSSGTLVWNTFLAGGSNDSRTGISVDGSGNVYLVSTTNSTWGSPVTAYSSFDDAYVVKMDTTGNITWNTFLGGTGIDESNGIAVDASGNVYISGNSSATWGSPVRVYTGSGDAFTAKLNSSGALTWNTFLGGVGNDTGYGIAVDGSGNVYLAGYSGSTWGSPVNAFITGPWQDAFAVKLDNSGNLTWNTFLGGTSADYGTGIAVDGIGNVYVSGTSWASWGNPLRTFADISSGDAFAAKLRSSGVLLVNTFLGSTSLGTLAIDGNRVVYLTGFGYASWGNPVHTFNGYSNAFVAKVNFAPEVLSITKASANPINSSTVDFTVTFSEPVTGVDGGDFSLTTSGSITGASIGTVSGSGAIYNVSVSTGTGDGTIRLDVIDDNSILNADLDSLGGTGIGDGNFNTGESYILDRTPPAVVSIVRAHTNPVSANTSVSFTVTFSEPVTGVDTSDFNLTTTGTISGDSLGIVSGSGAVYNVTVNSGGDDGTVRLDVNDDDSILDLATNPLGGPGAGNGDFINGETYTVIPYFLSTFLSVGGYDGWILESGQNSGLGKSVNSTSPVFILGDNQLNKQILSILSFNTKTLPDNATIVKVMLEIKRQGIVGINPFTTLGNILVDINTPYFGTSSNLKAEDFQASAGQTGVGTLLDAPDASNWYAVDLDPSAYSYVNLISTTQLRLRFAVNNNNNLTSDYIQFYSGNFGRAIFRPTLIVGYKLP